MQDLTIKPYLIQAFYSWSIDYKHTPLVQVVKYKNNIMPKHLINEPVIVLDITPQAINGLVFLENGLDFKARFNGTLHHIFIDYLSVKKIYTKEVGNALDFSSFMPDEDGNLLMHSDNPNEDKLNADGTKVTRDKKTALKIVSSNNLSDSSLINDKFKTEDKSEHNKNTNKENIDTKGTKVNEENNSNNNINKEGERKGGHLTIVK